MVRAEQSKTEQREQRAEQSRAEQSRAEHKTHLHPRVLSVQREVESGEKVRVGGAPLPERDVGDCVRRKGRVAAEHGLGKRDGEGPPDGGGGLARQRRGHAVVCARRVAARAERAVDASRHGVESGARVAARAVEQGLLHGHARAEVAREERGEVPVVQRGGVGGSEREAGVWVAWRGVAWRGVAWRGVA